VAVPIRPRRLPVSVQPRNWKPTDSFRPTRKEHDHTTHAWSRPVRRIWVREPVCKCISLISVSSCAVLLVLLLRFGSRLIFVVLVIDTGTTPESSEVELWAVSRTMTKCKILPNSTLRLAELSHRLAPQTGSQTQIHLARRVHEP
jgi:hypothetical protein